MTDSTAALHSYLSLFAPRNLAAWFLLAFSAGSVNAGAFLACRRFVTHVTGTATRVGLVGPRWPVWYDYAIVLVCFILGAAAAVACIEGRHHRGKTPLYAVPLLVVAALIGFVAISGHLGAFSPFGKTVETGGDFLMLSVLAFAMGLQNAAVTSTTAGAIRTTHMTGPVTDLGVSLATSAFAAGEARVRALRMAGLRFGKLASFVLGGAVMFQISGRLEYLGFLMPALVTLACVALSFVPSWLPEPQRESGPEAAG